MQNELHVLQPQLKLTSEQTEKLMVKIEQDTVNVEASKEVSNFLLFLIKILYSIWVYKSSSLTTCLSAPAKGSPLFLLTYLQTRFPGMI